MKTKHFFIDQKCVLIIQNGKEVDLGIKQKKGHNKKESEEAIKKIRFKEKRSTEKKTSPKEEENNKKEGC